MFDLLKTPLAEIEKGASSIVVSGANAAYENAVEITANHGSIVAVGLPHTKLGVDRTSITRSCIRKGITADAVVVVPLWSSKGLTLKREYSVSSYSAAGDTNMPRQL